jgi:phage terminase large subunit-like protein
MDDMKYEIPGLIPVEPRGDKDARFSAVASEFKNGLVYVPVRKWTEGLLDEWSSVPNYPFRDRTDTTSQALLYYQKKLNQLNIFDLQIDNVSGHKSSKWELKNVGIN